MKKEENSYMNINVNDLLILTDILDDFETFNKNYSNTFSKNRKYNGITDIEDIVSKFYRKDKKLQKFYQENEKVIETINAYNNLWGFFIRNYDSGKNIKLKKHMEYFYQYMKDNKENLNNIISVLRKLDKLGFEKFNFNPEFDFTKKTYYHSFNMQICDELLDNMYAVPSIDGIKYKTDDSAYKIKIHYYDSKVCPFFTEIDLNNLNFDFSRLPSYLNKKDIDNIFMNLKSSVKTESKLINSSASIEYDIRRLTNVYNSVFVTFSNLDNISNKEEYLNALRNIKTEIEKIQKLASKFDSEIISNNSNITEESLNLEKKLLIDYNTFHS